MEIITVYFIISVLLILYIISEVFKIEMLGMLSGMGLIIFSFQLKVFYDWLFILILFAGIVILAKSVLNYLWE